MCEQCENRITTANVKEGCFVVEQTEVEYEKVIRVMLDHCPICGGNRTCYQYNCKSMR